VTEPRLFTMNGLFSACYTLFYEWIAPCLQWFYRHISQ
jgi:hypothetical protein